MGEDAASPTSFYDEWNTSTAKTERTDEGTIEPPAGTQADLNMAKVPLGSGSDIDGDMASAASQLSPTGSDTEGGAVQLRPTKSDTESRTTTGRSTNIDLEGEGLLLRPRDSDTSSGTTRLRPTEQLRPTARLRPTAQLPAVTSHSWRDRTVLLYADEGQQKEQVKEVEEEKGVPEKQEEQEEQQEQERQEEQELEQEHQEGGLYDLSTVTGWRQEMSTGNTAKVTNTETSTAQETTTTKIRPTAKVATTTIKTRIPIQTTQGHVTIRKSDGRYLEPTFLFTTESSRRTKQLEQTTTQGGVEEKEASLSLVMPSHFFQLEDYPQDDNSTSDQGSDQEEGETTEKFAAARTPSGNAGVRESWLYRVNNTGEGGSNTADNNTSEELSNTTDNDTSEEENNTAAIDAGEVDRNATTEAELETTEVANITQVL